MHCHSVLIYRSSTLMPLTSSGNPASCSRAEPLLYGAIWVCAAPRWSLCILTSFHLALPTIAPKYVVNKPGAIQTDIGRHQHRHHGRGTAPISLECTTTSRSVGHSNEAAGDKGCLHRCTSYQGAARFCRCKWFRRSNEALVSSSCREQSTYIARLPSPASAL